MKFSFWREEIVILADCTKKRRNMAELRRQFRQFITIFDLTKSLKDVPSWSVGITPRCSKIASETEPTYYI